MKFLHLADLHLGKRLSGFSLIEDQEYILDELFKIAESENCSAVFISGDLYDKGVPTVEAVTLLDSFLSRAANAGILLFIISGNHDSSERVAFGSSLFNKSGIYISPSYSGTLSPVTVSDEYMTYDIYMLPFIKPVTVKRFFPNDKISSYTDAVGTALSSAKLKKDRVNILLSHQFITGAIKSDSEEISVGGSDNVDSSVFSGFDYVALGHIHRPQSAGSENIRYSGSPLKYSFSEADHKKSATVVEFNGSKTPQIKLIPLTPKRDLREIRGTYMELTDRNNYSGTNIDDYIHAVLTDEDDVLDAAAKLRAVYPNLMKMEYDNTRTRTAAVPIESASVNRKQPVEIFGDFFLMRNGKKLSSSQKKLAEKMIEEIWEEKK